MRVALPPHRSAAGKGRERSGWISREQENLLIAIAKQLEMSPQAVRNKMTELRDNEDVPSTDSLLYWPRPEEWDVLDEATLDRATRLRAGTLMRQATLSSPPFDVLIVIWRISQDPPPDLVRGYGDLEYVGGYEGMAANASLGEKAFLTDHGWSEPTETYRMMLGPNVSSLTRIWPARFRSTGLSKSVWDLITLVDKLTKSNKRVRILATGIDGFTTNVSSIAGITLDYPNLEVDLTTMIGFAWVDDVLNEVIQAFDSYPGSNFLYNTSAVKDIALRRGPGRLIANCWKSISASKLGEGPERNKAPFRNVQAYIAHEYKTLPNACALCLRRYGTTSALKLHFENMHAKPYKCRLCIGAIKKRFRHDDRMFATLAELVDHQRECSLGVLAIEED
jgi:hypothetical protein